MICLLFLPGNTFALDEDSDSLGFLPENASVVVAMDMDEFYGYSESVGRSWRDADVAHFLEGIQTISGLISRDELRPDVLTFFGRLSGVQAMSFDMDSQTPLAVFSAGNDTDGKILGNYTVTYILERRLYDSLTAILRGLEDFRYDWDEESENYIHDGYPADIYDLIEDGYLESIPINPYTGEQIKFLDKDDEPSYGDMIYEIGVPSVCCGGGCSGEEMDEEPGSGPETHCRYMLKAYCIGGINVSPGWANDFIPYDDFPDRLLDFDREYDISDLGFDVETDGGWTFYYPEGAEYAFASGGRHLLVGQDMDVLYDAVDRFVNGDGFEFDTPSDFDTSGAFMRSQTDPKGMMSGDNFACLGSPCGEELPPELEHMIQDMYGKIGLEAIEMQHTACWLRNSDIEMVRRIELTGEAENSLIGTIVNADPKLLMTAEGGPLGIIAEMAWANPDEFLHAYIDFIFEIVFPMIAPEIGMDPQAMLGMVGLQDIDEMEFGEMMYLFLTESEDRGGGNYIPGLSAVMKTDNEDIAYTAVNILDMMTMMIPDLPMHQVDTGDDTVFTWVVDNPECPVSPTIAWTDGWFVKGLFQDDVIAIRDALAAGEMLSPDGLYPANARFRCNRQDLLRGIADVMYVLPDGAAAAGAFFEGLALITDRDERLFSEVTGTDDYLESRCYFSIDLFENLIPALSYLMKADDEL